MKTLFLGAVVATAAIIVPLAAAPAAQTPPPKGPTAPAAAAPAPALPLGPPRAFAGYSQPDITAASCRVLDATRAMCTIPAMTAGKYIARASGTSTATAADAAQAIAVEIGTRSCGRADRRPSAQAPWASGPKTLKVDCEFTVVTDRPLNVVVLYGDAKATKDPKGPTLKIERAPWDGVMSAQMTAPQQ